MRGKTCGTMFNSEKLETWHEAIAFADIVCQLTRNFPAEDRFGLTNQMRRAAVSISSNLAEGCSRSSKIDYARFVVIRALGCRHPGTVKAPLEGRPCLCGNLLHGNVCG